MKKFITLLILICICAAAMLGIAACGSTPSDVTGGEQISEGTTPSEDTSEPDTPSDEDLDDGGYMPPPEEGNEVSRRYSFGEYGCSYA